MGAPGSGRRYVANVCPCCGQPDGTYWVFPADWRYTASLDEKPPPLPDTVDETVGWLLERRRRERTD